MKPLVILTGPTAVGKTELSIKLAKLLNSEIISADSMQVYKGMDIGTAKITEDEMQGVAHHLIDIITPFEEWDVSSFKTYSQKALDDIVMREKIPLVTGGTGFYIQALIKDVDFSHEDNSDVRNELEREYELKGADYLHEKLKEVDPVSAEIIHKNNVKRVIRALEFFKLNGYPISDHNKTQSENQSPYNFSYFVLTDERDKLYERINKRVDIMLENGLVDEVKRLKESGLDRSYVSMQGLGYKEILDYLDGKLTLEEAVYILKRDTRHFAKRQLTWFRREKHVIMINKSDYSGTDEILEYMISILREKGII